MKTRYSYDNTLASRVCQLFHQTLVKATTWGVALSGGGRATVLVLGHSS